VPYLHLRLSAHPSHDDATRIASVLTDLTVEILRKERELTAVSIETVAAQLWTIGGVPLACLPVQSFFLDVQVSAGANSKYEMADYIARAYAALEALLGPLAPASYVAIHEHAADAWGYQGLTQEFRAGAATALSATARRPATTAATGVDAPLVHFN
jgi:4-oxalocrotonate tautomerase